jgi:hypothetical protein
MTSVLRPTPHAHAGGKPARDEASLRGRIRTRLRGSRRGEERRGPARTGNGQVRVEAEMPEDSTSGCRPLDEGDQEELALAAYNAVGGRVRDRRQGASATGRSCGALKRSSSSSPTVPEDAVSGLERS